MIKENLKYRISRKALFFSGICMLLQMLMPTVSLALTGGPASPEFSSFEPVATTSMVSDFSGDFTYNLPVINVPGANGGGYALSLSYHSGASPEEEASWVGYGWTLNPGAINRGKRGFADDDNGTTVKYWNMTPANKTASLGVAFSAEGFSTDLPLNLNASLRYNNYKGFGYTAGAGISYGNGLISLGYSVSDGEGSFSVRVNPLANLNSQHKTEDEKKKDAEKAKYDNKKRKGMTGDDKKADTEKRKEASKQSRESKNSGAMGMGAMSLAGSNYGIFSFSDAVRPVSLTAYKGQSYNLTASVLGAISPAQVGPTYDINGSFTWQENVNNQGQTRAASALPVYGYMYSHNAGASGNNMMDYYTEKLNPYDKWDRYLGIPFSNADAFNVAGEGIGGSFRLYNKKAGHFRPNAVNSHTEVFNIGAEIEAGLNIGGGADLGVGFQRFSANSWDNNVINNNTFANPASEDEAYFFRFNNDLGGSMTYGSSDAPQQASFSGYYSPALGSINKNMNNGSRSGRSSYIAWHTNSEMLLTENNKKYKAYCLSNDINSMVDRSQLSDGIGELTVFNEEGLRYVYGLPVYSRKEGQMQYDLNGVQASAISNNYLAYRFVSNNDLLKTKVGEERDLPYASQYLLTEITSNDYVDRTLDGPSDDDFGGYTRFSYKRLYGSNNKTDYNSTNWYKWRMPYTGLLYSRGEHSTQLDDMGSVSYGEKEVYYLDTIVTKTHFAVFYTSARNDGMEAADNNTAAYSSTAKGSKTLQKLDSIVVFAKNAGAAQRMKKVCFQYDYSLCSGLPNSSNSGGKLSLKKVWMEYEGIQNARIAPYIFEYAYSTTTYPAKYSTMGNYGSGKTENPAYSAFSLDAWGNYQANGASRFAAMKSWLDQNPASSFDPAAWQLKVIKMPTGGEIHVQYEQDEYSYVQDKPVEAMVSLLSGVNGMDNEITNSLDNKYYLNVADLGISSTTDKDELVKRINDLYVLPQKKMYFKFLYRLIGFNQPDLNDCNAEYIKGYCSVKSAGRDGTGVYVQLGSPTGLGGNTAHSLPKNVCRDYLKTQRAGNLNLSGQCDGSSSGINTDANPKDIVMQLLGFMTTNFLPNYGEICTRLRPDASYLRVPMTKAKKGGGVRVKRILMYDAGLENGDAALYGSEYSYTNADGSSSGVATNEPGTIREENALIEFDPKLKQSFLSKVISGRDKEQSEKPLGESIYPSASVGYGRVVIKNIHSGKTSIGYAVNEYYTAKDYPVKVENTEIDSRKEFNLLPGGLINLMVNNLWATQGYTFTLNNMHGQKKREQTFSADPNTNNATLSSSAEYTYFQPGESIPVMDGPNFIGYANPGKETELLFESRGVEDISHSPALEFDIDVGIAFIPIPFGSMTPSYTYTESKLYTHVTNRVVNYPAVVKSVLSYADGIYHLNENLGFNPVNGQPLLTRTTDGFNRLDLQLSGPKHKGAYYGYNYLAPQEYAAMGQKAANERAILVSGANNVNIAKNVDGNNKYYLEFSAASSTACICDAMGKLSPGDLVKLSSSGGSNWGVFHIADTVVVNKMYLLPLANYGTQSSTGSGAKVEVLRSGKTNQLNTTIGGFTSYGDTLNFGNIGSAQLALRKQLADQLNVLLAAGGGTLNGTSLPASLKGYTAYLPCSAISSFNFQLSVNTTYQTVLLTTSYNGHSYCDPLPLRLNGKFAIDGPNMDLVYFNPGNSCQPYRYTCFTFCSGGLNTKLVVQASAQTYSDNWPYDNAVYPALANSNKYENGSKGKWRQQSSYAYTDSIIGANAANQRIYKNAGCFEMQAFNWELPAASENSQKWLKLNTITRYSPDGNALEEKDILGIYSAAKFGYDKTQPYLVAKNAPYQSVQFESFERAYQSNTQLEDAWAPSGIATYRSTAEAHSGTASWQLASGLSLSLKSMKADAQLLDAASGLLLKVWVRTPDAITTVPISGTLAGSASLNFNFTKVARTGKWTLYEARISGTDIDAVFNSGDSFTPRINNLLAGTSLYLDDIRVQPLDASMSAYVYDPNNLRLVASLDDQNFALFYQYNAEGKLVRKLVETERGVKTITETQYNTPLQARP